MNRKTINILLLLIFSSATMVWSQAAIPQDDPRFNQLGNQFTQAQLARSDRKAFEQRAIEKLRDLSDYLALVGSASYHTDMRAEAARVAMDLFRDPNQSFVYLKPQPGAADQTGPIADYLEQLRADTRFEEVRTELAYVKLIQGAQAREKEGYQGRLAFRLNMEFLSGGEPINGKSYTGEIDFWLLRLEKQFGEAKKMVWETKLGSVVDK